MTSSVPHGGITSAGNIHIAYQWSYANAAARTGAAGFVAGDLGKFARQTDDNSIWMLTATTPTWVQVGGSGAGYTDEQVRDVMGVALVAGNNIDITVNDGADTITIDVETLTSVDVSDFSEAVDDRVSALMVAGNNIDLTYNDGANTLTVDVEALTSADLSDFTEAAQDATGAMVVDTSSTTFVYVDATPSLAVNVKDEYVQDTVGPMFTGGSHTGLTATYQDGTGTIDLAVTASAGLDLPFGGWISQNHYSAAALLGGSDGSQANNALVADTMHACLFPVPTATSFDLITVNVSAAIAASTIRLGVYAVGADGLPAALIADWGTVSSATTGLKALAISWSPAAGWYYLVQVSTHTPGTTRIAAGLPVSPFGNGTASMQSTTDCTKASAGSSAALPNPFGATPGATGTHRPLWLRAA